MRRFACPQCGNRVFFNDHQCLKCATSLGFDHLADQIIATDGLSVCANRSEYKCNWIAAGGTACQACSVEVGPPASDPEVDEFRSAIRRMLRQLHVLQVEYVYTTPNLRFALRRSTDDSKVVIGHEDGLITLDVAEADPVYREETRARLGEPYRTSLGHVRHEAGHWHWQACIATNTETLAKFRATFGDETIDYPDALARHYAVGDDGKWQAEHLSFYAGAHPWEDYAETFAHLLHLTDTLETARSEGLALPAWGTPAQRYQQWIEVTVSLNELSRSMGMSDLYPFAPPPTAINKILFLAGLIPAVNLA